MDLPEAIPLVDFRPVETYRKSYIPLLTIPQGDGNIGVLYPPRIIIQDPHKFSGALRAPDVVVDVGDTFWRSAAAASSSL